MLSAVAEAPAGEHQAPAAAAPSPRRELSDQQKAAVFTNGHLLVSSCPGSGKTTVLAHRAAHLLKGSASAIVGAVTFTNDAATELEERIRKLSPGAGRRIISGNFHQHAMRQLRTTGVQFKVASKFKVAELIRSAHMKHVGKSFTLAETKEAVELYKSQPDYPLPSPDQDVRVLAFNAYQAALDAAGEVDFADMLLRVIYGMRNGDVATLKVTHLLVDEFQDSDPLQFEWIRAHVAAGVIVTCVGDDDQSIYSWRFSLGVDGMRRFVKLARAQEVVLDTTYRCAPEILGAAARLIGRNTERIAKHLRTTSTIEGSVSMQGHQLRTSEMQSTVRAVLASGEPARWGILARTNSLLEVLEGEIAKAFPYVRVGAESLWDMVGPQILLGVLNAVAHRTFSGIDTLLLRCGASSSAMEELRDIVAPRYRGSLLRFTGLRDQDMSASCVGQIGDLRTLLPEWLDKIETRQLEHALYVISAFIVKYVRWGRGKTVSEERLNQERARLELCSKRIATYEGSLVDILRQLLNTDDADTPGARLMTLHSSKGLEFDYVWIVGCEQGVLPSNKADLEEERRLMYVGMTRARERLVLSYCRENESKASEFIEQAGIFM